MHASAEHVLCMTEFRSLRIEFGVAFPSMHVLHLLTVLGGEGQYSID